MTRESDFTCPESPALDRRQLLRIAGCSASALVVAHFVPACGDTKSAASSDAVPTGLLPTSIGVDSIAVLPSQQIVVARDSKGLYAMTAICTHKQCTVGSRSTSLADGLVCPCHGSSFDGSGRVTGGPAQAPLRHLKITVAADGTVTVDPNTSVATDERVSV